MQPPPDQPDMARAFVFFGLSAGVTHALILYLVLLTFRRVGAGAATWRATILMTLLGYRG